MSQESKSLSKKQIVEKTFKNIQELIRKDPDSPPQGLSIYHVAAIKGDCNEMFKLITERRASRETINEVSQHEILPRSPIEYAIIANDEVMVKFLKTFDIEALKLAKKSSVPSVVEEADKNGHTLLIKAIYYGKAMAAKALITPSNINRKDIDGNTPLHHAIVHNEVEIVKVLLEANCEVGNIVNGTGRDEVLYALGTGNLEVFKLLTGKIVNYNELYICSAERQLADKLSNQKCFTLLGLAAARNNEKFLNYLISKYSKEEIYQVLLSILEVYQKINSFHYNIFKVMFKGNLKKFDKYLSVIMGRKDLSDNEKLRALIFDFKPKLETGVKLEQKSKPKAKSKQEVVEVSDSLEAEIETSEIKKSQPVQTVAAPSQPPIREVYVKPYSLSFDEVMAYAIKRDDKADITMLKRRQNNERFMSAVAANDVAYIEPFLKTKGFNQNHFGSNSGRPIHVALECGNLEMAKLLLAHMDYSDELLGESILMMAAERGYDEIVALLLPRKEDSKEVAGAKEKNIKFGVAGGRALLTALQNLRSKVAPLQQDSEEDYEVSVLLIDEVETRYSRVVLQLIEAGANINIKDPRNNRTPLMYAAELGLTEIVSALLKNKADLECFDVGGRTALMHAVYANKCATTQAILEHNPSLHERDGSGRNIWNHIDDHRKTPIGNGAFVEKFDNPSMREVLKSHLKQRTHKRKAEDDANGAGFVVDKRIDRGIRMWSSKENEASSNAAAYIAQEQWPYPSTSFNQ